METGVVFNIQRYSVHDGPGIRTTVFLKGCPLRCRWCHNPESLDPRPALSLIAERCIGCGACVEVCPNGLARRLDEDIRRTASLLGCARCGACAEACPSGARTMIGKSINLGALMTELARDRLFYDESGGGVTFSGGEPLMKGANLEFLLACLAACGEEGYHRAVDTSGYAPRETVLAVAERADLLLYDLKLMDDASHRHYVGVGNRLILENLEALSKRGSNVWVRVPLIPGVNDDEENLQATARFVASLAKPYPVHLLPYHKVGGDKYRRLGNRYALSHLEPPPKEHASAIAERMRELGLAVKIGG